MSARSENELKLLAKLEKCSTPPSETVEWILERTGGIKGVKRLDERLSFEYEMFSRAGRTINDLQLYRHHVGEIRSAKKLLEDAAWDKLLELLKSGEAMAFAVRVPVNHEYPRLPIPRILWSILELDRKKGRATGPGYEFHDVRIAVLYDLPRPHVERCWNVAAERVRQIETEAAVEKTASIAADAAGEVTNDISKLIRLEIVKPVQVQSIPSDYQQQHSTNVGDPGPSFPGRPSVMHRIAQEMEERARTGRLLRTLHDESEALSQWAKENLKDHQIPGPKSIQNALRDQYRNLRESTSP